MKALLGTAAVVLALCLTPLLAAPDITGTWTLTLDPDFAGQRSEADCTLTQDGEQLTGKCGPSPLVGTVTGRDLSWKLTVAPFGPDGNKLDVEFSGQLDDQGTTMSGAWQVGTVHGKFEGRKH